MKKKVVEKNSYLVGKWVLTDSIMVGGVVSSRPRLVTKVSGKRVYTSVRCLNGEMEDESYSAIGKVRYVFESENDAVEAANECKSLWINWFDTQQNHMRAGSIKILETKGSVFRG